jgi:hypothetical protein
MTQIDPLLTATTGSYWAVKICFLKQPLTGQDFMSVNHCGFDVVIRDYIQGHIFLP